MGESRGPRPLTGFALPARGSAVCWFSPNTYVSPSLSKSMEYDRTGITLYDGEEVGEKFRRLREEEGLTNTGMLRELIREYSEHKDEER